MTQIALKRCSKCGVEKTLDAFNKDSGATDGKYRWCRDCSRASSLSHYRANADAYLARTKERRKDPEKYQQQLEINRRWGARNRNKTRHYSKASTARSKGAVLVDLTLEEWQELLTAANNACVYCKTPFTGDNPAQQDHEVPLSRGGQHTKGNIVPACRPCNRAKGNRTGIEFMQGRLLAA